MIITIIIIKINIRNIFYYWKQPHHNYNYIIAIRHVLGHDYWNDYCYDTARAELELQLKVFVSICGCYLFQHCRHVLQLPDLLVVAAPLCNDAHCAGQLGLLGQRVVAL